MLKPKILSITSIWSVLIFNQIDIKILLDYYPEKLIEVL